MLIAKGEKIDRIADVIKGKKAGDIILKARKVIDVKYFDWTHWRWRIPENIKALAEKMAVQVARRKQEYPKYEIVYVFAGPKADIPKPIVQALEKAGAKVQGSY